MHHYEYPEGIHGSGKMNGMDNHGTDNGNDNGNDNYGNDNGNLNGVSNY